MNPHTQGQDPPAPPLTGQTGAAAPPDQPCRTDENLRACAATSALSAQEDLARSQAASRRAARWGETGPKNTLEGHFPGDQAPRRNQMSLLVAASATRPSTDMRMPLTPSMIVEPSVTTSETRATELIVVSSVLPAASVAVTASV